MTEAEKKMKKYCNAVERRLNMPGGVKARVMSDFSSSIIARREAGQNDEEIYADLGSPRKAAAELNEQMKEFTYRKSPWRFLFLAIAVAFGAWLILYGLLSVYALITVSSIMAAGNTVSTGIIGGADGPTAIFVTTRYGVDWDIVIAAVLVIVGIIGFLRLRKCEKK